MLVHHRFELNKKLIAKLKTIKSDFGYNGLSEASFYRTYSRMKADGLNENWLDVVVRNVQGTFSIRKDWYIKNHIDWDERYWQNYSEQYTKFLFDMKWVPPGRGLWAMGTDFVYTEGSMALQNCGFIKITDNISECMSWLMDALMLGVGVGFEPIRNDNIKIYNPRGICEHIITDDREGWVKSVKLLIDSYCSGGKKELRFNYNEIRPAGELIKRFGGISSGPEPLKILHDQIKYFFIRYMKDKDYDSVLLKTDIANVIGCCIVSGNVRRSAELCKGYINDLSFLNLKNYDKYKYRESWGWMSNNSVALSVDEDFEKLDEVARRVIVNGEPGIINLKNMKYGRIGKFDPVREDKADGFNPCITGDTKIAVADGRGFVPIKDLIGIDTKVYCIDDKDEVNIRLMRNPRKTGTNQKILKITFDDGNYIRVTENHKVMLRDRSFVEAKNLVNGHSVAIFNRYVPSGNGDSYFDKYIHIGYSGKCSAEHQYIAKDKTGILSSNELHTHHIDGNKLNNHPDNLELKREFEHLSPHSRGENNPNWSTYSYEQILQFGVQLAKKLNRRFSQDEWKNQGLVDFRRSQFGSFLDFAILCADFAEVLNENIDPRTLRLYQEMCNQNYDPEIINGKVYVNKTCEGCKETFLLESNRREESCCSLSCYNRIRNYKLNQEGQRKYFAKQNETNRERQLIIYLDLKRKLNRIPLRSEWEEECSLHGIPHRFGSQSPFSSYTNLKASAWGMNHKVVWVEEGGYEDVYNGTVDEFHNYIIGGWEDELQSNIVVQRGIINQNCGEQPLEDRELCTLAETCPTKCDSIEEWYQACRYATFYASTVTLLPTHSKVTNRVMAKNRRIGVSIVDFVGLKEKYGTPKTIKYLREAYKIIRSTNQELNGEAGIPEAIRVTTIKPGGTVPKIVGRRSGMSYASYKYMIRRMRVSIYSPIYNILVKSNYPHEPDLFSQNTEVFEFPIGPYDDAKTADQVTIWEQAMNLILLQREFSDNAVSNTLCFKPKWILIDEIYNKNEARKKCKQYKLLSTENNETNHHKLTIKNNCYLFYRFDPRHEENDVESVLTQIASQIKSAALLPHTPKGVYKQMPEEGITEEEYLKRLKEIKPLDFSAFSGSDGQDEKYCTGDYCEQ